MLLEQAGPVLEPFQFGDDARRSMTIAVRVLDAPELLPELGPERTANGLNDGRGVRRSVDDVGGAKSSLLPISDVDRGEAETRRFPDCTRRVADHEIGDRHQIEVRSLAER